MTFRFDDVCINSDMKLHNQMTDYLFEKFSGCKIIWAISPLVRSNQKEEQRVFPCLWNACSDKQVHYHLDSFGIPEIPISVYPATHGLVHIDHRLLGYEAQQLSIILSASLIKNVLFFVPPFNKWNSDTEKICEENKIELIKFEDGWLSMEHNKFDDHSGKWYLHARQWTMETLKNWFEK